MELSLRSFFQDFNASKFVVHSAVLIFAILLALRQDGSIACPYWCVFIPLFVWKILVICGAVVGCGIHWKYPPPRNDHSSELEYRSMILCVGEHILLFMFEILVCYKLQSNSDMYWTLIFVPLLFQSVISIVVCVWAVRREKSFEFELFFSVNVLQFTFLALKLDKLVDWSWVIIFIPLWILICLSLIGVLYAIVLAILLIRSIDLLPEHRRQHVYTAIGYTFLVVPILIFLVLLTAKLDGESTHSFVMVCTPLYISLVCLILMACGTRGGNSWWFGIRRDFCTFLLDSCPCLREYGNVSYKFNSNRNSHNRDRSTGRQRNQDTDSADAHLELAPQRQPTVVVTKDLKPVLAVVSIECPD